MVRELLALVVLAAAVLVVLVGRPGTGASWLTADRVGEPLRFQGVVSGEARLEVSDYDWHRIVVDLKVDAGAPRGRSPLDVVLLVDTSNSMRRDRRLHRARAWSAALVRGLVPEDRLALVGFARRPEVLVPLGAVRDVDEELGRVRPAGPTDLGAALAVAARVAPRVPGRLRRVLILAGGAPNHGFRADEALTSRRPGSGAVLVDLTRTSGDSLGWSWGGRTLSAVEPSAAAIEEALDARHHAVRDLRIQAIGPAAARLPFQASQGHLILGGGSLGDLDSGSRRRLEAAFPEQGRSLRGPLALHLSYRVPDGDGWKAAEEGGTLHL